MGQQPRADTTCRESHSRPQLISTLAMRGRLFEHSILVTAVASIFNTTNEESCDGIRRCTLMGKRGTVIPNPKKHGRTTGGKMTPPTATGCTVQRSLDCQVVLFAAKSWHR